MMQRKFVGLAFATIVLVGLTGCSLLSTLQSLQTTVGNLIPHAPFDLLPNVSLPSFQELLAPALGG